MDSLIERAEKELAAAKDLDFALYPLVELIRDLKDALAAREQSEDDGFIKSLAEKQNGLEDYNRLMDYARLISGRLRQMDKRAKAANKRVSALQWELNSLKKSQPLPDAPQPPKGAGS